MKKNDEEFNQIFTVSMLRKLQLSGLDFEFWHTPNGGSRNKAEAGKMKLMGMLAGVPDLCIMAYNIFHFIEFKKKKGVLSQVQKDFIEKSHRYGWKVSIVYADTPRECMEQVCKIMVDCFGADQKTISSMSASVLIGAEKS